MHPDPRRIVPVVLILALVAASVWYFTGGQAAAQTGALAASGTIEATEVRLSPELGGRVVAVNAAAGDLVDAGQALVEIDAAALTQQLAQTTAQVDLVRAQQAAAQAAARAAEANLNLLRAGASPEQLAVAQTVVDRAQIAVDALRESYDDLAEAAQDAPAGKALKQQLDTAEATLANAQAQYDLTAAGARPEQVAAAQAQWEAAQAQVEVASAQLAAAEAARAVINTQLAKLTLRAPLNAVVLARTIEPGEMATPGATLLLLADLSRLTITVYVPEDRYGQLTLGQSAEVTTDSFPGETFTATVVRIADRAEFTPRNVQTADGRRTTVFAVELAVEAEAGQLKPGMPADVVFAR